MRFLLFMIAVLGVNSAMAMDEFIRKESRFSVTDTVQRIETILDGNKAVNIMATVDHAANAGKKGLELRPTVLLIFGNPALGTRLMQENQEAGVDLPMKMLVWEDEEGRVWLSYINPLSLGSRHKLAGSQPVLEKMSGALNMISDKATGSTQ